jgi:hypothetical protein
MSDKLGEMAIPVSHQVKNTMCSMSMDQIVPVRPIHPRPVRLVGGGLLVLVCSERKVLLADC